MILHCSKARIMWSLVFTLYGMTWGNALFNKRKPTKFDMVLLQERSGRKLREPLLYIFMDVMDEKKQEAI